MVVKIVLVVIFFELYHKSHKDKETNIEIYFAYEVSDSKHDHMVLLILILLISLLNQIEVLITSLMIEVLRNIFFPPIMFLNYNVHAFIVNIIFRN